MSMKKVREWVVQILYSNRVSRAITQRIAMDERCLRDIMAHPVMVFRLENDRDIRIKFEKLHQHVNPNYSIVDRISRFTMDEQRAILQQLDLSLVVDSLSPDEILDVLSRESLSEILGDVNATKDTPLGDRARPPKKGRTEPHRPFSETRHAIHATSLSAPLIRRWLDQLPIDATVFLLTPEELRESIQEQFESTRQVKGTLAVSVAVETGDADPGLHNRLAEFEIQDVVIPSEESSVAPELIQGLSACGFKEFLLYNGDEARQIQQGDDAELHFRSYTMA